MALRDYFLAPVPPDDAPAPPRGNDRPALSLAVLAPAGDVPALAAAAGLALSRGAPAVLVCLLTTPTDPPPALLPPRAAASRLARSLNARDLASHVRGRLVVTHAPEAGARALAAAAAAPTVLGAAVRSPEADALVAGQDAVLVALPPSVDPALANLALAGAATLGRAAAVTVRLDPLLRALALGGIRAPRGVARAVRELM